MDTVKGYIAKYTPNSRPNPTVPQHTQPQPKEYSKSANSPPISKTTTNQQSTQEFTLPPNFGSLEAWHRYIKKIIGSFLDNAELESGAKFAGTIKNGYYFCRLNNYTHEVCGPLQEFKRLALAAHQNTDDSNSSARANLAKEDQSELTDSYINNISNNDDTNYVDSSFNKTSIKSNIVLSCKSIHSYFTSHKSNAQYVDDEHDNKRTSSSNTKGNITQMSNICSNKQVEILLNKKLVVNPIIPSKPNNNHSSQIQNNIIDNRDKIISDETIITTSNSSIIKYVDKRCNNKIIDHRSISISNNKYNTTQSQQSKLVITSVHEPIFTKLLNNKFNKCNPSINLLVDIDLKQGEIKTIIINQNNITSANLWPPPSTYTKNNMFS